MDLDDILANPPPGWERYEQNGRVLLRFDRSRAMLDGKPYFEHPGDVQKLKREGRLEDAARLLERLIAVVEDEADNSPFGTGWKLAPWYYEQLAIVYRKLKRYSDEVLILHRYIHHPNAIPERVDSFRARQRKALEISSRARGPRS